MFERIKVFFLSWFFKKYVFSGQSPKPRRYPEEPADTDLPRFIDRYAERNSDQTTMEIHEKVMGAVSRLKASGHRWKGGE